MAEPVPRDSGIAARAVRLGRWSLLPLLMTSLGLMTSWGCVSESPPKVIVYAALDEDFSAPIFAEYEQETGVEVRAKFDTEATKSVGLTQGILAERRNPRCDLFWNNEILNTIRLEKEGLLRKYDSVVGRQYPAELRSPEGTWYGFAPRARILIVNTEALAKDNWPHSVFDLADAQWAGRCGIAKPLFGTTATHASVLFSILGKEKAGAFFAQVQQNAVTLAGNKQVALDVAAGRLDWGLTDTDDAFVEIRKGRPVQIIFPDQDGLRNAHPRESQVGEQAASRFAARGLSSASTMATRYGGSTPLGTLFIPNTLALIANSPHPREGEALLESVLSVETESRLVAGPSAQFPTHPDSTQQAQIAPPAELKKMNVDWDNAWESWQLSREIITQIFASAT